MPQELQRQVSVLFAEGLLPSPTGKHADEMVWISMVSVLPVGQGLLAPTASSLRFIEKDGR